MGYDRSNTTIFPNGVNRFSAVAVGGAAGAHTFVGGPKEGDTIVQVFALELDNGAPDDVHDLTDEFEIGAENTVTNEGGTDTTGMFLMMVYDMAYRNREESY